MKTPIDPKDIIYSVKYVCSRADFLNSADRLIDRIIDRCENPNGWEDKLLAHKIEKTTIVIVGTVNGIDENLILFVKNNS